MAVFTPVADEQAQDLLKDYSIGELRALTGIAAGIENTNYFLDTTQGQFVLTVFEVLRIEQLPFYVELMHTLGNQGLAVPMPQTRRDGQRISKLQNKPTIIVTKLPGQWVKEPTPQHCALAAQAMAKIHLGGATFGIKQPNLRGLAWWQATAPGLTEFLSPGQRALLSQTLAQQTALADSGALDDLPQGPAHCDYFRDNVLFTGSTQAPALGGVIDFYFAGCDYWLFDLAVAVNDWCIDHTSGLFKPELLQSWLSAYQAIRPLSARERERWPEMLQAAALRFWVSRLYDFYRPRPAETLKPHDPTHFEQVLEMRVRVAPPAISEAN